MEIGFPLSPNVVAMFTAYLYQNNFASAASRSDLSSIAYSHNILNLKNPADSFLVNKMVKGIALERQVCDSHRTQCPNDWLNFKD